MSVAMNVVYEGSLKCQATHLPSGSVIHTEAPVDNGGKGESFSPTDLLGTALASCVLTIMGIVAQRQGLDLRGASARVVKDMTTVPVRRVGSLAVVVTMPAGLNLSEEDRTRLENAAAACPVKKSLHPDIDIKIEFVW